MVQLSSTVFVVVIPVGGFAAASALSLWLTACWRSLAPVFDSAMRNVSERLAARLYRADPSLIVLVLVNVLATPLTRRLVLTLTVLVSVNVPTQVEPDPPEQESLTAATPPLETFARPPMASDPGGVQLVKTSLPNEVTPVASPIRGRPRRSSTLASIE